MTDTSGQQSWAPTDFELTVDAASPDEPVLVVAARRRDRRRDDTDAQRTVSNPAGGSLNVSVASCGMPRAPEFTIIALPDTQHYSESFPAIFTVTDAVDRRTTRRRATSSL